MQFFKKLSDGHYVVVLAVNDASECFGIISQDINLVLLQRLILDDKRHQVLENQFLMQCAQLVEDLEVELVGLIRLRHQAQSFQVGFN
jgi:hypothetical protein